MSGHDGSGAPRAPHGDVATRIVLRPIGTPLPIGFLGLAVATTALAALQLGWLPSDQGRVVALAVLVLTVPITAGASKLLPVAVMAGTAVRFVLTAVAHLTGSSAWEAVAGVAGLALGVLAVYGALALELEDTRKRTVLPVGRRGAAKTALSAEHTDDQLDGVVREAGVREQL